MSSETASKSYKNRGKTPNPVKNPGSPCRKAHAKLGGRIADYQWMLAQGVSWYAGRSGPAKRVDSNGYHRPGSMQR